MPTSVVSWLPAIFIAMFFRAIPQKLAPLPMSAISAFGSSSSLTSIRRSSQKNTPHDSNSVLVQAYYRYPLQRDESNALAQLPPNRQLLVKEAPILADRIALGIRNQLDKHDIGGTTTITNNLGHFQDYEKRWSKMFSEIDRQRGQIHHLEESLRIQRGQIHHLRESELDSMHRYAVIHLMEFHNTTHTMQSVLKSRGGRGQGSEAFMQAPADATKVEAIAKARATRNRVSHALDLKPSLYVVDENPTLELTFDAFFGLSSIEAKALLEFDKDRSFHVNKILSYHAELWKSGLPDTFVGSFRLWLDAMRLLQSKQSLSETDPTLVSSTKILAQETNDKAVVDLRTAEFQGLSNPRKMKKLLARKWSKNVPDPYHWDKIISDWKDRGLWQKLLAEWKLLPIQ